MFSIVPSVAIKETAKVDNTTESRGGRTIGAENRSGGLTPWSDHDNLMRSGVHPMWGVVNPRKGEGGGTGKKKRVQKSSGRNPKVSGESRLKGRC